MTIRSLYPDVEPTLNLDFTRLKRLPASITFTRASTGTYVDKSGIIQTAAINRPRLTYDSSTLKPLGLLVEEARTNISPYSSYVASQWTFQAASLGSSSKTGVFGSSVTAFLADSSTTAHRIIRTLSGSYTANTLYTISFYVAKPASSDILGLVVRVRSAAGGQAVAMVVSNNGESSTYTFSSSNPFGANPPAAITSSSVSVVSVANNWTRISVTTAVASVDTTLTQWDISFSTSSGGETGAGTANSELYIDGVQVELGAFATSVIPTTGTTATRAADAATITGTNFSRWYRQDEGTVYVEASAAQSGGVFGVDDGTNNERWRIGHNGTSSGLLAVIDGGVTQVSITSPVSSWSLGTISKAAAGVKLNDFALCVSGQSAVTDTGGTMPTVDKATIENAQGSTAVNGTISRITYWPARISNTNLQELTR